MTVSESRVVRRSELEAREAIRPKIGALARVVGIGGKTCCIGYTTCRNRGKATFHKSQLTARKTAGMAWMMARRR